MGSMEGVAEDARVLRSRTAVKDAFERLATDGDLESISISQLCKAAGVSRPTFYQHFADIDDVYAAVVRDRLEAEEALFTRSAQDEGSDLLEHMLERVQSRDARTAPALDARGALPRARSVVFQWMCERVARGAYDETLEELTPGQRRRVEFAVGGMMAILGREHQQQEEDAVESEASAAVLRESLRAVLHPERD
jgi:AcrR family transcriptional regulator